MFCCSLNCPHCSFPFPFFYFQSSLLSIGAGQKIFCCPMNCQRGSFSFPLSFFSIRPRSPFERGRKYFFSNESSAWQFFPSFFLIQSSVFCRGAEKVNYLRIVSGQFSIVKLAVITFWPLHCPVVCRGVGIVNHLRFVHGRNFKLQKSTFVIRTSNSVGALSVRVALSCGLPITSLYQPQNHPKPSISVGFMP
jgi:hypothetical protein